MEINDLIGIWEVDKSDSVSVFKYGNVSMAFSEDGKLVYCKNDGKEQHCALMTYSVEGNEIITNQPSAPKEVRIKFEINNEKLKLFSDDGVTFYVRRKV